MPLPVIYLILIMLLQSLASPAHAEQSEFIRFDDPGLIKGREIWLANCQSCHAYGTAGAPVPADPQDWRQRVKKEKSILYRHAIEGFFGEDDTMMPARGGNPDLSDRQVKLAVDYMLELATYYINKTGK